MTQAHLFDCQRAFVFTRQLFLARVAGGVLVHFDVRAMVRGT